MFAGIIASVDLLFLHLLISTGFFFLFSPFIRIQRFCVVKLKEMVEIYKRSSGGSKMLVTGNWSYRN